MKRRVHVQFAAAASGAPPRARVAAWARAALTGSGRGKLSVGVRIVGRKESARLNLQFRRQPGPTNVLSFPFDAPPGTRSDLLGDVVICADVVRREARQQHKLESAHWAHMVVHGIMHLRGYDHLTSKDAAVMEARETRVLRSLGFADPYV